MNQVEIVQKAYSDFGRGDIAAILEAMDDSVEWVTPGDDALSGIRKGKSGVTEFFTLVAATWHFDAFEPKQFIASGDHVVAIGSYSARSIATERAASCDWAMLWTLRNGKIYPLPGVHRYGGTESSAPREHSRQRLTADRKISLEEAQ